MCGQTCPRPARAPAPRLPTSYRCPRLPRAFSITAFKWARSWRPVMTSFE